MPATAKLFKNGNSQAVRLPRAFRLPGKEASIRREGHKIILEPLGSAKWPKGFFRSIRIDDRAFERPPQGELPSLIDLGS